MSTDGPHFYAWCDEADRTEAFAGAVHALVHPRDFCGLHVFSLDPPGETSRDSLSRDEIIALVRAAFATSTLVRADFGVRMKCGRWHEFAVECGGDAWERRYPSGPLELWLCDRSDLMVQRLDVAVGNAPRSVAVEAAILSIQIQADIEDLLLRLCSPNEHARVTTGACSNGSWHAPVELCATYHADENVARDLALSWLHLHDRELVGRAASLSPDFLRVRVEAALPGARVALPRDVEHLRDHFRQEHAALEEAKRAHVTAPARGPRAFLPGDDELTREQVLAALATPPVTLLEALEAAAVPDEEWRAVEPIAIENIEAKKQGVPTYDVDVTTRKHMRFIEQHAPYHVQRLPNGGVMLATHPYRILWPLWADALSLLGIAG